MQGRIRRAMSGVKMKLRRKPTTMPLFVKIANLRFVCESMPVWAKMYPIYSTAYHARS